MASVVERTSTWTVPAPMFPSTTVMAMALVQAWAPCPWNTVPAKGCGVPCVQAETGESQALFAPTAWIR